LALSSILIIVIIVFSAVILALVARLLWRKSQQAVADRYHDIRYEKYSRMIDETVADEPAAGSGAGIVKQVGDEEVLETLLRGKLGYFKGEDRSRVAAKLKDIGLTEDYKKRLSSPDPVKRARSLEVLGELRMVDLADRFLQGLKDDDGDVRLTAARGLANLIDELKTTGVNDDRTGPLIEALVLLIEESERWPVRRIAGIIAGIGPDAIDPLMIELRSSKGDVRALAADILGAIGDQKACDRLIASLSDPETDVRARAATALGVLGNAKAVKPLIKAAQDEAWPVRARAAKSLGRIGDQIAVRPLAQLLKDRQWWVRRNAGYALSAIGEPGLEMLEKNLSNPDPYAAERALEVLEETGRISAFVHELGSERTKTRNRAVALLVAIGRIGGLAPIIEATGETADDRVIVSLIEVWRELTEHLAETLASGEKQAEIKAIESTNKIAYSFVLENIGSYKARKIPDIDTSLAEIDKNMAKIKQAIGHLKQDIDPELRDEAAAAFNFMER